MKVVDVQCFAGGMTLGAVQAGLDLIAKVEHEGGFGVAQCEANRHLLGDNWMAQTGPASSWVPKKADIVISNPPCAGFSVLSNPGFRGVDSRINSCMWDAVRYAAKCDPQIYVMESVRAAFSGGISLMRALRDELETLTGHRYTLHHVLQDNYSLGGCSKRSRYFMVCSRVPFGVEAPALDLVPTVGDAIGDLLDQPLSWSKQAYISPPTWWSKRLRTDDGTDGHETMPECDSHLVMELIRDENDVWLEGESEGTAARTFYERHGDLPARWQTKKHTTRATGKVQSHADWAIHEKNFDLGMFQVKRWVWDRPANVVTGAGPMIGIHPKLPRFFTHREIARIMGFPDDWAIEPLKDNKTLQTGWGKGVSVDCGRWISQWAKASIEGEPGSYQTGRRVSELLPDAGDVEREFLIDVSKHWKTASNAEEVSKRPSKPGRTVLRSVA